jgi:hypothetical protein
MLSNLMVFPVGSVNASLCINLNILVKIIKIFLLNDVSSRQALLLSLLLLSHRNAENAHGVQVLILMDFSRLSKSVKVPSLRISNDS